MPRNFNQKYKQAAQEFARRVTAALGDQVDAIVLYGSVARGDARRDSDIDILVISPDPNCIRNKVSEICGDLSVEHRFTVFLSPVELSREGLDWHIRVRSPFLNNVIEDGVVLYDNGTFSRVREQATTASGRSPG